MKQITRMPALPERDPRGHKGTFGRVLVVGGSQGMIGAPGFAGLAALRMGCGLAYIAAPAEVLSVILGAAPELVGVSDDLVEMRGRCDAIVAGPGLGQSRWAQTALGKVVRCSCPLLLDADALNLIAAGKIKLKRPMGSTVLTPHPGEMARLGGVFGVTDIPDDPKGRVEVAVKAARYFGQIVLLKGQRTVISDGKRVAVNPSGDSSLAKAGSGDVLSGMIGTLLAQRMPAFEAAMLGAYLHGRAGEAAGKKLGQRSVLARDIIEAIAVTIKQA